MYLRNSNLVCIYVGFYINEFAEDGAEMQNATGVSWPRPPRGYQLTCDRDFVFLPWASVSLFMEK